MEIYYSVSDRPTRNIGFEHAISTSTLGVVLTDALQSDQPIVFVNEAFTKLTGYSFDEAIGRNCRFLQGPLTDQRVVAEVRKTIASGQSGRFELLNYRKDGEHFWNVMNLNPILDWNGRLTHYASFLQNAGCERSVAEGLIYAEEQLANVVRNIPGYIFRRVMHPDTKLDYTFISPSIYRILGVPEDSSWSYQDFIDHMHPDDRAAFLHTIIASGLTLTPVRSEFRMVGSNGEEHWFRSDSTPHLMPGGDVVWEGVATDITIEKVAEAQLTYLAQHDILTGLCNRSLFRVSVTEAICNVALPSVTAALLCIDLDEFQILNEELGYAVGDLVLRHVSQALLAFATLRKGVVARLGGDEFALLIPAINPDVDLHALCEAVRLELCRSESFCGHDVRVESCIGAVLYEDLRDPALCSSDERAAELMRRADLALRRAKQEGAANCHVYSTEIDDRISNRLALRRTLQDGLTRDQFQLHYQPLVDLSDGRIVGAEALVRWEHPELGMQRPDLFIPYAEASGLIVPLGAWIMKRAVSQFQSWRKEGLNPPRIAINLSSVQLQRPDFIRMVEQMLFETGASAANFEFELTEGTLVGAASDIHRQLQSLRDLGFGLAIDDFGTGHSTLKSLRDFPVTKVKIDQTFIKQLVIDSSDASIIRAIVALARSLALEVVGEGIETTMQRNFLLQEGCRVGQGYLLSLPLNAEDFSWLLRNERRLLPPASESEPQARLSETRKAAVR